MGSCAKKVKNGTLRDINNELKKARNLLRGGIEHVARHAYMWFYKGKLCHKQVRDAVARLRHGEVYSWFQKYLLGGHYKFDAIPMTG